MYKKILFSILITGSYALQAQTIKGVVADKKSNNPIEFAPVALLSLPDSVLVASYSSETGGTFAFYNIKPGNYYLRATYVGYAPAGRAIEVKNGQPLAFDTLFMAETSKEIDEVVVTGERIKGQELVDRTVYSIPAEVSKASPNAYELLKKVPAITVDYNDNVSLNGSTNFIIQVDGKQRDKEFLARLQPSDIESIEVINNPSGKYEGNIDGVINVKLKREARYGFGGNINAAARPSEQTSANLSGALDYAMGNATAYVSAHGFYNNLNSDYLNKTNLLLLDSSINMSGKGTYMFALGSLNTGIDYFQNKYNTFSFNVNYKPVDNTIGMNQSSEILKNNIKTHLQEFGSETSTLSHEINTSVFYKRQFETPIRELTMEASVYNFISTDESWLNKKTFFSNMMPFDSVTRTENANNNRNSINFKTDYVHPIGMDYKLETGIQLYTQQMDFKAAYSYDVLKNNYLYSEFRPAAYAGFSANINKLGIQTTLRVEHSRVNINDTMPDNYFAWLPSANILYKFNSAHNVKLTYNRRINRPNITQLNPFEKIGAGDEINSGNPLLGPENRDRLQLTYTYSKQRNYVAPYIYYEEYSNKTENFTNLRYSHRLNRETLFAAPQNILSGNEQGVGLNAMILFVNINFRYFKGHFNEYNGGIIPIKARNYESYAIGGWAFAPLPWKINIFAFAHYSGNVATVQGTSMSPFFYGTGARKEFEKHSVGLFYLLPFTSRTTVMKNTINTPQIYSYSEAGFDSRFFIQLQYSYRFNKGKAAKKVTRQVEVESDSKKNAMGQ